MFTAVLFALGVVTTAFYFPAILPEQFAVYTLRYEMAIVSRAPACQRLRDGPIRFGRIFLFIDTRAKWKSKGLSFWAMYAFCFLSIYNSAPSRHGGTITAGSLSAKEKLTQRRVVA